MKSSRRLRPYSSGFTLTEVMIVVAIVAILAGIALPSYLDYVRRGQIQEGTTALSDVRVKMEQYYQDKRKYTAGPCTDSAQYAQYTRSITYGCVIPDDDHFKITATGKESLTGFTYTINESGIRTSTAWGTTNTTCWIVKKGESC